MIEDTSDASDVWRDRLNRANKRAYDNAQLYNAARAKAQHLQFRLDDAEGCLGQLCDAWDTIPVGARTEIAIIARKFTEVFQMIYGKVAEEELAHD